MNTDELYREVILRNDQVFQSVLRLPTLVNGQPHQRVGILNALATFAWGNHTGRYNSLDFDSLIRSIAQQLKLPAIQAKETKKVDQRAQVVILVSRVEATGGHTRLVENIASYEKQRGNEVLLVLTTQSLDEIPKRLKSQNSAFAEICSVKDLKLSEQVRNIRRSLGTAERVYNSQHPNDIVIPISLDFALACPVFYLCHTDHVFNVGSSFSDAIINIRPWARDLTVKRRTSTIPSVVLPIRLSLTEAVLTKEEARAKLGRTKDDVILLTISASYKVIPDNHYDMFKVINAILENNSQVQYYFIGINGEEYAQLTKIPKSERLHLLGVLEDPYVYQRACDMYLEGMPMNSLTALIDSVYAGAFPVLMWGPYHVNMNESEDCYIGKEVSHPADEASYLEYVNKMIFNKGFQSSPVVGNIISNILKYNSCEYWDDTIDAIAPLANEYKKGVDSEFQINIEDLRLAENWQDIWNHSGRDNVILLLKELRQFISKSELVLLFFRHVWKNPQYSFLSKIKRVRQICM